MKKDVIIRYLPNTTTQEEIKILEPYYLPNFGVPASQEDLMLVCMDKQIAHFTLKEANAARKIVA